MRTSKAVFFIFLISLILLPNWIFAQNITPGFPLLEEVQRRNQLLGDSTNTYSFSFRTSSINPSVLFFDKAQQPTKRPLAEFSLLPVLATMRYNSSRPYGWGDFGMIPNKGFQSYLSAGIHARFSILNLQLQPEWTAAQNLPFDSFSSFYAGRINGVRSYYWYSGDNPERFGDKGFTRLNLGQSSLTLRYGAFEIGASTRNIWWGPGQWNSLIFSNNAPGFAHLTLNTTKPAKTFLGSFEGQIIMGRLEPSYFPNQTTATNPDFYSAPASDWRYMNGMTITYQPKWIKGLSVGINRTFQQYSENKGNEFGDWFPIFEPFQKKKLFANGNSVLYDEKAQDQQASFFGRYLFQPAKAELYFEFGRRDHAYDFRDAIMSPEHARAYLMGFSKLVDLASTSKDLQIRAEVTQQQESVNRYIRYSGTVGGLTWHTHGQVRGFTNHGQPMGVGIGTGSNVQTIEIALVDRFEKMGILLERLENNQDFYYRAFGLQNERKPWVDFSIGFLFDKQIGNLLLSSKLQVIQGLNYQWQLDEKSTPQYPKGINQTSVMAQASLIYFLEKKPK
jgi:hypothetical protein